MLEVDRLSRAGRLSRIRAASKALAAFVLVTLALGIDRVAVDALVAGAACTVAVGVGRVPVRSWVTITGAQAGFLFASVIAMVLVLAPGGAVGHGVNLGVFTVGVDGRRLPDAAHAFGRAVAAGSALTALALTTPVEELAGLARKLRVPSLIVDIALLVLRFAWSLKDALFRMTTAQESRLGYATWGSSLRSASLVASGLLTLTLRKVERTSEAMAARGNEGELPRLQPVDQEDGLPLLAATGALSAIGVALAMAGLP